jgi:hypothetical protein
MPTESGYTDPILDELHAIRKQMLTECGGELDRLVASLQKREAESGRVFIKMPAEGDTLAARQEQ